MFFRSVGESLSGYRIERLRAVVVGGTWSVFSSLVEVGRLFRGWRF